MTPNLTSPPPRPNPIPIFEALTAYQTSFALKAGIDLDLFSVIGEGLRTAGAIATRLSASERGVRILCDALTVFGFLTKTEDGSYGLTTDSEVFLVRKSPAYVGGASGFLMTDELVRAFEDLPVAVRLGGTVLPGAGTVTYDNPVWVEFAHGMANMMFPAAQEIARNVIPATGGSPAKVLDIAAGPGIFGISVARHHPQARITACDWASVLGVAEQNAMRFGVMDRFQRLIGDAMEVEFGTGYDVVLVTNFFHHFDKKANIELMNKSRPSLAPGGRVITLEFVPNPDRVSPPPAAVFPLVMLATTRNGDAYTLTEYREMFEAAGYSSTEAVALEMSPETVLVSRVSI
jgi:ubiquinone/menaquinone biosynthesis C-methylase UbiE